MFLCTRGVVRLSGIRNTKTHLVRIIVAPRLVDRLNSVHLLKSAGARSALGAASAQRSTAYSSPEKSRIRQCLLPSAADA